MAFDKNKINKKSDFDTAEDDVLKDFYIPVLKESVKYDGAVGFFSTHGLLRILQGIEGLVKNKGHMRLLIGKPLTDEEYEAFKKTDDDTQIFSQWNNDWSELFNQNFSKINRYRLEVFSWLLNNKYLQIKYAVRRRGMYHKKIGILEDEKGDFIVFSGSINLTNNAVISHADNPDGNSEEFSVYPSWEEREFERHGAAKIEYFNKVWNGEEVNTTTLPLPSDDYQVIHDVYTKHEPPISQLEEELEKIYDDRFEKENSSKRTKFELYDHQKSALKHWKNNNYRGILALATGSGKTVTAIHALIKVSEATFNKNKKLCVIVAVPYVVLADQWVDELEKHAGVTPMKCYGGSDKWFSQLNDKIRNFRLGNIDLLLIVVVNATLGNTKFQSQLDLLQSSEQGKLFIISDECHHHANKRIIDKLPKADFIMGLSATPWTNNDQKSETLLKSYYGGIVDVFTIDDALEKNILCQYKYYIHEVSMDSGEEETYIDLTNKIAPLYKRKIEVGLSREEDLMLQNIIFKRARHLDSIEDKFNVLDRILKTKQPEPFKLFYCGSGSQVNDEEDRDANQESLRTIDRITSILDKNNWSVSKFTSEESHDRRVSILDSFKRQEINAIAAIKVLDEGFDIPMCDEAYITASTSNERQWVQRRGRILRKSKGKEFATIHDFVITKTSDSGIFQGLIKNEMKRVDEFFRSCANKEDIKSKIDKIKLTYNLE
jgi:superfamily II DNA or RNA helicase